MIKNNKGITLIALVVTIIILLILASAGFYYGDLSVESSKYQRLSSQMQAMQLKMNQLYEEKTEINISGENVDESNGSFSVVENKGVEIGNKSDYKSYTSIQAEEIFGIKDVEPEIRFLINFNKRRVIIDGGYTYDNTTYYVIEDFKDIFNVDYNGFKYNVKDGIGNSTVTISDVKLNGENVGFLLPDEYQQVEYIESTGTQYINTNIEAKSCKSYEIQFRSTGIVKNVSSWDLDGIFGVNGTDNDVKLWFVYSNDRTKAYNQIVINNKGVNSNQINISDYYKTKHNARLEVDKNVIYDGENIGQITGTEEKPVSRTLFLFAVNDAGETRKFYSKTKMYYVNLYDSSSELIANFIPCYRKSDNIIGMYDTVSNTFFENQGTGSFIKGNDVESLNVNSVKYKKQNETKWTSNENSNKIKIGEKGTYSLKVELSDGKSIQYDNVEVNPIEAAANSPELTEEMIPVTWNRERLSWVKADKDNLDNSWYNYNKDSNMWANVVTVNQNGTYSREFYRNAEVGTEILMSDINGMFVWIPRFTYKATIDENNKITTVDGIKYSNGIEDNASYSKEGIDFGEAKGIWVSKFECSNDSNGNLNVKPNVNSAKNIVYNGENGAYTISQNLTADNNIYGFDSGKIESNIIKDSSWEAVAILSKGVTSNTAIYNNSYFEGNKDNVAITRTGMVGIGTEGNENASTTEISFEKMIKTENTGKISLGSAKNFYEYWTNEGQKASTTQNVYGIYDMSGGGSEYVQKEEDKVWIRGGTFSVYEDILEGASEGEQNKSYSDVSFRVILTVK